MTNESKIVGIVAIILVVVISLISIKRVAPNAGYEAVLIKKPWVFGHGGVAPSPVSTGLAWVAPTTYAVMVNVQPQQFSMHFDDLMSKDGVPLDFDSVLRIKVIDSVGLISRFGEQWFENNLQAEFANRVRQAVRKHGMNETAIDASAINDIDKEVSDALRAYIETAKLPVSLIEVTVGRANPPDAVKNQRISTAEQEQRANTEKQRRDAEVQRKEAEIARANADRAFRDTLQLSPEQYIKLEAIKMQREVCTKNTCNIILGDAVPTVNMGRN